jgi:hypothetical protein
MGTADMEEEFAQLAALLSKQGNRGYRRYDLKRIDGRLMLVRDEIDRAFDLAISEVYGIELEPDEMERFWISATTALDHGILSPKSIAKPALDGRLFIFRAIHPV